jgi:O-antigen/teichoic acid export membrane protein
VSRTNHQDLFSVAVPKVVNGATTLFISAYAIRFLDPGGYGVLSFCTNCLVLFDALLGSALDLSVARSVTHAGIPVSDRLNRAEKASISVKLIVGFGMILLALLVGESLGHRIFQQPGGRAQLTILTVAGTALLLLRSLQLYFQVRLRFLWFGATDLMYSTLRLLFMAAIVIAGQPSAAGFLAAYAVSPILVVSIFSLSLWKRLDWSGARQRLADGREVLRSSATILLTFGVSSLVSRLDLFLLAFRGNPVQLGLYGAALTIATIPEILGSYLAPVFLPRILPARMEGRFYSMFRHFHLIAFCCAGVMVMLTLLVAKPVLSIVLPLKYAKSIGLVQILLPATLVAATIFPLTLNFLMLTRPRVFLMVDLAAAPFMAIAFFWLAPSHGAVGVAWISAGFRVVKTIVVQTIAFRLARMDNQRAPTPPAEATLPAPP